MFFVLINAFRFSNIWIPDKYNLLKRQDVEERHRGDAVLLCETFLNSGNRFRVSGYVFYRNDRPRIGQHHPKGGTAILIKKSIPMVTSPILKSVEATTIVVKFGNQEVLLGAARVCSIPTWRCPGRINLVYLRGVSSRVYNVLS